MYDLRPRKTRKPPPDPQPAIRRAAQQPRTGLTNVNRGSLQPPRTVGNNANKGTFSPLTKDDTEQVYIRKCGHSNQHSRVSLRSSAFDLAKDFKRRMVGIIMMDLHAMSFKFELEFQEFTSLVI